MSELFPTTKQATGWHLLADLYGIEADLLTQAPLIEQLLREAAEAAGATILLGHFHSFGPMQGVTGVLLLAESHISIHTWPEFGFAAADIFMCGQAQPQTAMEVIRLALKPSSCDVNTTRRGVAQTS